MRLDDALVDRLRPHAPILITGATGFIGCALSRLLHEAGLEVVPCGRSANPPEADRCRELEALGLAVTDIDVTDPGQTDKALRGIRSVVHLAAAQHEAGKPEAFFQTVNVEGTRNLLDSAVAAGAGRFVYGSSIGVFGTGDAQPLSETSPPSPNNAYGRSKLAAEAVVGKYAAQIGTAIVRISETYGESDGRLLKLFKAASKGRMLQVGDGANLHQPIHVHDLAVGILQALCSEAASGEIFILAGCERISTAQMITNVTAAIGKGTRTIRLPMNLMMAACVVCEKVFGAIGRQPPLHPRRLEFFTKNLTFDIAKARKTLGFEPAIDFDEGCRLSADYYRAKGMIDD